MRGAIFLLATLFAGPATAQDGAAQMPKTVCATIDQTLPAPYAAWTSKRIQPVAMTPAEVPLAQLTPGRAVVASLGLVSDISYVKAPDSPPPPTSKGGMFELRISQAGRYSFALDAGAWVELVADGKFIKSADHGHAPPCSSIRKQVEFDLPAGRYVVQFSQSPKAELAVLVARLR